MKIIAILQGQNENGMVNYPAEPFPANAVKIVSDGTQYIVYEPGDTLPPEPPASPPSPELTLQEKMQKIVDLANELGVEL